MKKELLYLASVLAIAGCAKETLVEDLTEAGPGIKIIASITDSKTSHSEDDQEGIKTTWVAEDAIGVYAYKQSTENHYWLNYKGVADADAEVASFTIKDGYILAGAWVDYKIYTYYPFNSSIATVQHMNETDPVGDSEPTAIPITVPASQSQISAGDFSHLASTDFLYGYAVNQWDYNDVTGESQKIHVNFHHALSVLEVSLTSEQSGVNVSSVTATIEDESELFSLSEASINLENGSIVPFAGTPSISVNLLESARLSSTPSKVYLQITPGHAGKVLSIYASVNGQNQKVGAVKVPADGIPAGVKAVLSFNIEYTAPSEFTDLSAGGTANCYLINTPGTYKFKATVKGNGVVPSQLADVVVGSVDIAPKSALILWYNTLQTSSIWKDASPVVISSVELTEDGYIQFYTPSELVPGNVVIAAFAEEGLTYDNIEADEKKLFTNATMLWSWNIWVVADGYDLDSRTLSAGGYTVMDRNLGALIDGSTSTNPYELVSAIGNHYQWGRKDPFPTFADYASNNSFPCQYGSLLLTTPTFTPIVALQINSQGANKNVNKQMFGYELDANGSVNTKTCVNYAGKSSFAASTDKLDHYLDFATRHPYKFIGGVRGVGDNTLEYSNFNWYYKTDSDKTYKALWGDGETYSTSRTIVKSLYDPCPAGWRVMTYEAATAVKDSFTNATVASNLHGVISQGIYYPHTGRGREYGSFRIEYVGSTGYTTDAFYWHSTADKGYNGYCYPGRLAVSSPANYTAGSEATAAIAIDRCGAQGLNIRCIKE